MVTRSDEFCTSERNLRSLAASADSALIFSARALPLQRRLMAGPIRARLLFSR